MIDDHTLVSRVLGGDIQAFKLLIRQHERLVAHMISRVIKNQEELEEVCQDVFLKVYEKLGGFGFQSKLSTWIATIAYRQAINHARKQKIDMTEIPEGEHFSAYFVDTDTPETLTEEADVDQFVLKLAEQLPPQYKTVLLLYHVEGMTYPEIGSITGMPEGTVKSYLFRARNLLKDCVLRHADKEEII